MEALCRMFLWGVNSEGNHKVPLVAWKEIQKTKKTGGLAMENFQVASKALRMRQPQGSRRRGSSELPYRSTLESDRKWTKRLYLIWNSPLQNKDKVWTWRLLQHGLPLLDRMTKWSKGDGKWKRCRDTETKEHLITDCIESQKRWHEWQSRTSGSKLEWRNTDDFIQMIDEVWKEKSWAKATALVKITWSIWLDRNAITFTGGRNITPSKVIGVQSKHSLDALAERHKDGSNRKQEINDAARMLEEISAIGEQDPVESEANLQTNADTNNPEPTPIDQRS
ncbi:hypothetical protein R1sor_021224 [Riccia sorocarpa]|uniref:Reverse transcriptase zinc-binding domain-containing protein n=1 Tax=Riccia sorocarpa TaxID=122646 RepID=A0ABD3GGF7_9MARC